MNGLLLLAASVQEETTAPAEEVIQREVSKATSIIGSVGDKFMAGLPSLVIALIFLVIGIVLSRLIAFLISKAMKRSNIDSAARSFLISLIRIILYVTVIMMALTLINVPMSSIITIFGAAGLAISLALQNCLSNLCGGFIILFSKPFVSGDKIDIDGSQGTVESISILYTKMVTPDHKTVFIPNGKVSDAKIINFTESPTRRVDMIFSISYNSDFDRARSLIFDAIKNEPLILASPEPIVRMRPHAESSIDIDVLVWAENGNYFTVKYNITEAVKHSFDENGIIIPYRQLDIHITEQ